MTKSAPTPEATAFVQPNSYWMYAAGIILLDQLTKTLVRSNDLMFSSGPLTIGSYLNPNGFLGFQLSNGILLAIGAMITILLFVWLVVASERQATQIGIWLIAAGTISNLLDRLVYGGVVDIISLDFLSRFNLADVSILAGAFVWLVGATWAERRR